MRLVMLLLIATAGVASAQPRAVEVEVPSTRVREHHHHGPAGLGAGVAFGWAGQIDGPSGWSARLDYEVLPVYGHRPDAAGFVFGAQPGIEVWRSGDDNWGFSLPIGIVAGARLFPMRAVVGVGVDAILIDQVNDDTGVGFYAPFALAKLGFDVSGFQLGLDARLGYRWQIDAPDHGRWQLGLYAIKTIDIAARDRRRRGVAVAAPR